MPRRCRKPAATMGDVFVSTNSLTKAYGLAGLRCGWILASPQVSQRVREMRDIIDGSGAFAAEQLSVTAFGQIDRLRTRARSILSENLAAVRAMAQSNPYLEWLEPAAGTTAFPRVKGVDDTGELVDRLIRDHDTIVVPGDSSSAAAHQDCIRWPRGDGQGGVGPPRSRAVKFFWLNFHLPYACRDSGMCCTAGLRHPVERSRVKAIEETHRTQCDSSPRRAVAAERHGRSR